MFSYDEFREKLVPGILIKRKFEYALSQPTKEVLYLVLQQLPSGFVPLTTLTEQILARSCRSSFTPYELYIKMIEKEMEFYFL